MTYETQDGNRNYLFTLKEIGQINMDPTKSTDNMHVMNIIMTHNLNYKYKYTQKAMNSYEKKFFMRFYMNI